MAKFIDPNVFVAKPVGFGPSLLRVLGPAKVENTNEWLHAVDDGTSGKIVLSTVCGGEVYMAEVDPTEPESVANAAWQPITTQFDIPAEVHVHDIWHVYKWGYHWISCSFEYKIDQTKMSPDADDPERNLFQTLRVYKVAHDGEHSFPVKGMAWLVNSAFYRAHADGTEARTYSNQPEVWGLTSQGLPLWKQISETNDHFMTIWPGALAGGGLAVGLRAGGPELEDAPSFAKITGTLFLHLDVGLNLVRFSSVGRHSDYFECIGSDDEDYCEDQQVLGHDAGCSGWGENRVVTTLRGASVVATVVYLFTTQTLAEDQLSDINVLEVRAPGLQATRNPSKPGLVEAHARVIRHQDGSWNNAMATGRKIDGLSTWLGTEPGWLITWRRRDLSSSEEDRGDDGDIVRQWFDPDFKRVGGVVSLTTGSIANRPHTLAWRHAGEQYLITTWDQAFQNDSGGSSKSGMIQVERLVFREGLTEVAGSMS